MACFWTDLVVVTQECGESPPAEGWRGVGGASNGDTLQVSGTDLCGYDLDTAGTVVFTDVAIYTVSSDTSLREDVDGEIVIVDGICAGGIITNIDPNLEANRISTYFTAAGPFAATYTAFFDWEYAAEGFGWSFYDGPIYGEAMVSVDGNAPVKVYLLTRWF